MRLVSLWEETRASSPSLCHPRGWEEVAVYKSGRELLLESNQGGTLILDFRLQNCENINFYCLSHPVYGILLRQPELRERVSDLPRATQWTLTAQLRLELICSHFSLFSLTEKLQSLEGLEMETSWMQDRQFRDCPASATLEDLRASQAWPPVPDCFVIAPPLPSPQGELGQADFSRFRRGSASSWHWAWPMFLGKPSGPGGFPSWGREN